VSGTITLFNALFVPAEEEFGLGLRFLAVIFGTVIGVITGALYFATDPLRAQGSWAKAAANLITFGAYCILALTPLVVAFLSERDAWMH
jgi:ABC-type enterochelin transport system permease subunit